MSELSPFQKRVYAALKEIPKGRVTTYKILADHIDCQSAQAIGQALKKNPFAPEVPCHRVIKSDLTIGGYFGAIFGTELTKKISLLRAEGIEFGDKGELKERQLLYLF